MIFCVIGKSATGKDSIYKELLKRTGGCLKTVVPYTTRPQRSGETEGIEYHFRSWEEFEQLKEAGRIIEYRCYHTIYGDWFYFTADDGQIVTDAGNYLLIMTLEGYESLRKYYGKENIVPIYIEVEDGLRLTRALEREKQQREPKYAELCRRFLADREDFSEEKIAGLGIEKRYENIVLEACISEILADMRPYFADTESAPAE